MATTMQKFVRAASIAEVDAAGRLPVQVDGHAIVLFADRGQIYAVDNRCPHMGFPLHRGSLKDGILTCHWHHARFDLATGGTFDPWADDVRVFPTQVRNGEVWIDLAPPDHLRAHHRQRLREGLEREIPLVIAKSVVTLLAAGDDPGEPLRIGLEFGAKYRRDGWGQGLTILTCMHNLLPHLEPDDRPRALYHGLAAVARDCAGVPPRFELRPLPGSVTEVSALKRWFRRFVEVRDAEGAERCLVTAVRAGADAGQMADLMFSAATDHRYVSTGNLLDFTNKAFEALDAAGWQHAEAVLSSLAPGFAEADRMEESNEWRHPIDLVEIVERAFERLPDALDRGRLRRGQWAGAEALIPVLLGEDPQAIADALLDALQNGCAEVDLAGLVARAAALRIAHFHTSNEFTDWDTALHTFTFANAVQQGLRRAPAAELVRGVLDGAMSVYLDRFLNVPPAPLPQPDPGVEPPDEHLAEFPALLNKQQQVNEAGLLVAAYLTRGGDPARLLAALGKALLREDRNFHTIQAVEAAVRQFADAGTAADGVNMLVAAARYLAAHAPTMRAQGQTYTIALRLHRGEKLYEE
jgi:nitrite reductase/ring-hydroxylating ferredoxin subunit